MGYALLCRACGLSSAPLCGVEARLDEHPDLYPYQRVGAAWLARRWAALLADDMGLGKTVQALMAIPGARAMVICKAALKGVWGDEQKRWRADMTHTVLEGRHGWRWPIPGELAIANPEILPDDPGDAPAGVTLIADEAHWAKNPNAKRTKKWRAVAACARQAGGRVWLLTGTPSKGKPDELWEVLRSGGLAYAAFGRRKNFKSAFRGPLSCERPPNAAEGLEIGRALAPVELRRMKADVLPDLPPRRIVTRRVTLDPEAARRVTEAAALIAVGAELDRMVADGRLADPRAHVLSEHERERRLDLLRRAREDLLDAQWDHRAIMEAVEEAIASRHGVAFEELSKVRRILAEAKIPGMLALVEEAEEAGKPLVVFSVHRSPIQLLAGRPGWGKIMGGDPSPARDAVRKRFKAGEVTGLALTLGAGGEGLTLVSCGDQVVDHGVFVDLAWRPTENRQAEDRLVRIGQVASSVLFTRLVADHAVDRRVHELLESYSATLDAVDAGRSAAASSQGQASPKAASSHSAGTSSAPF